MKDPNKRYRERTLDLINSKTDPIERAHKALFHFEIKEIEYKDLTRHNIRCTF